jgi:hypothetical protein
MNSRILYNQKNKVYPFVSSFLNKKKYEIVSILELHKYIRNHINKKNLKIENIKLFRIDNELESFLQSCAIISKSRGKEITVPNSMHWVHIKPYLQYCFISIQCERKKYFFDVVCNELYCVLTKKYFLGVVCNELYSFVFHPSRISFWINYVDIDIKPFNSRLLQLNNSNNDPINN